MATPRSKPGTARWAALLTLALFLVAAYAAWERWTPIAVVALIAAGTVAWVVQWRALGRIHALQASPSTQDPSATGQVAANGQGEAAGLAELRRRLEGMREEAGEHATCVSDQSEVVLALNSLITEIALGTKESNRLADSVIATARASEEFSRGGQRLVGEAVSGILEVGAHVQRTAEKIAVFSEIADRVTDIVDMIHELAEESNVLALNGAIQAARAGDQGQTFAVLAREMRVLSIRSRQGAIEVRKALSQVGSATQELNLVTAEGSTRSRDAVSLAEQAGKAIVDLARAIEQSSSAARQIATNTRQQVASVEGIVPGLEGLVAAILQESERARLIEESVRELHALVKTGSQ